MLELRKVQLTEEKNDDNNNNKNSILYQTKCDH